MCNDSLHLYFKVLLSNRFSNIDISSINVNVYVLQGSVVTLFR